MKNGKKNKGHADDAVLVKVDRALEDVVPEYLEDTKAEALSIEGLALSGDFQAVRDIAHRLKGEGASFGFDELSRLGAAMVKAADEKDRDEVLVLRRELLHYLDRVKVVYKD